MNQVYEVSYVVFQLCGSVGGRAQKGDNGRGLASGVLSRRRLFPGTRPDARHFSSPHMPLVPFQLLPQSWSPEGVSLCRY